MPLNSLYGILGTVSNDPERNNSAYNLPTGSHIVHIIVIVVIILGSYHTGGRIYA